MNKKLLINAFAALAALTLLGGCNFFSGGKADAPVNSNLELKESRGVSSTDSNGKGLFAWGGGGDKSAAIGLGVNSYLWRATLDTLAFMPLVSADPFGGVIITDWYEDPRTKGERYKINAYITDKTLNVDALKLTIFKQQIDAKGNWHYSEPNKALADDIEDTILTRAREMRLSQAK